MLTLRHYQEDAVGSVFSYFMEHAEGNPIIALPTGTGKSIVIAEFIRRALMWYPQTRILVVTHVKELIKQNFDELLAVWPQAPAGIYSAGLKRRDVHYPVTFCGIASIANRAEDFGHIDLVLVDECHTISHKADTMYAKALEALRKTNPNVRLIGLSATPYRLGLGMLTEGGLFTDICCDWCSMERFNQLVDEGFIAPLVPRATTTELDVSGVAVQGEDFVASQLQAAVDKETVTRAALEECVRLGADRKHWLMFTTGVDHANHVCAILNEFGIVSVPVHSKLEHFDPRFTPLKGEEPRDMHIRIFKEGKVQALVSVGVLTTGFNYRPVDFIGMLRPTVSPVLWVQMLGRGTRPAPDFDKRDCLVLDFAANTKRLGPINDPVVPKKKGKKAKADPPYKICPACSTYNHTRAAFCVHCGEAFPAPVNIGQQAAEDELIRKKRDKQEPEPSHVETFEVTRADYAAHVSRDPSKPVSLKITYHCGFRVFNEWLCLEHGGFAAKKARDAWRLFESAHRAQYSLPDEEEIVPPDTVAEALQRLEYISVPRAVRVMVKPKFSEVIGYDFDFTAKPAPEVDPENCPF